MPQSTNPQPNQVYHVNTLSGTIPAMTLETIAYYAVKNCNHLISTLKEIHSPCTLGQIPPHIRLDDNSSTESQTV